MAAVREGAELNLRVKSLAEVLGIHFQAGFGLQETLLAVFVCLKLHHAGFESRLAGLQLLLQLPHSVCRLLCLVLALPSQLADLGPLLFHLQG